MWTSLEAFLIVIIVPFCIFFAGFFIGLLQESPRIESDLIKNAYDDMTVRRRDPKFPKSLGKYSLFKVVNLEDSCSWKLLWNAYEEEVRRFGCD